VPRHLAPSGSVASASGSTASSSARCPADQTRGQRSDRCGPGDVDCALVSSHRGTNHSAKGDQPTGGLHYAQLHMAPLSGCRRLRMRIKGEDRCH
jgi:hypothetical protein